MDLREVRPVLGRGVDIAEDVDPVDRVRGRVGAFTLLAEAFSQDLSTHFRGEGRYVLHKPIEQSQFDRTLEAIEARLHGVEVGSPEL